MERVQAGMRVNASDDTRLGLVQGVKNCCIEVRVIDGGLSYFRADGIFNVSYGTVTLICDADAVHRYSCRLHPLHQGGRRLAEAFTG